MEGLLNSLADHYVLYIIISLLLIFALIGYFVKKKSNTSQPYKIADANAQAEIDLANLAQSVNKDVSLQDFVNHRVENSAPQVTEQQPQVSVEQVVEQVPVQTVQSIETPVNTTVETVDSLNDLNM